MSLGHSSRTGGRRSPPHTFSVDRCALNDLNRSCHLVTVNQAKPIPCFLFSCLSAAGQNEQPRQSPSVGRHEAVSVGQRAFLGRIRWQCGETAMVAVRKLSNCAEIGTGCVLCASGVCMHASAAHIDSQNTGTDAAFALSFPVCMFRCC